MSSENHHLFTIFFIVCSFSLGHSLKPGDKKPSSSLMHLLTEDDARFSNSGSDPPEEESLEKVNDEGPWETANVHGRSVPGGRVLSQLKRLKSKDAPSEDLDYPKEDEEEKKGEEEVEGGEGEEVEGGEGEEGFVAPFKLASGQERICRRSRVNIMGCEAEVFHVGEMPMFYYGLSIMHTSLSEKVCSCPMPRLDPKCKGSIQRVARYMENLCYFFAY